MKILYRGCIYEAKHIGRGLDEPLKDDDVITVYHGFNEFLDAAITVTYGLSGKVRIPRIYSYENNNNPRGLFVSPKFEATKYFANSGVIIEFNVKVNQLEAPVWPGKGYTVQGGMSEYFKDEDEREKKRLLNREEDRNSEDKNIANSDRPELSTTLVNMGEKQALYIGDLNPNMIRAVWYNEILHTQRRTNGSWTRMSVKDFIKLIPSDTLKTKGGYYNSNIDSKIERSNSKAFKPNDELTTEGLNKIANMYGLGLDKVIELFTKLVNRDSLDEINYFMWPKQIEQFKERYVK